jgi:hypothetical protein
MKATFLLLGICLSLAGTAQKKVTVKKGDIKLEGQLIAEYDGVGSMFKLVKQGVFAPGSKDTLISVTEENWDPKNPLWPGSEVVYKLEFRNGAKPFYVSNTKYKGVRFLERDAMQMVFNDSVPQLVAGGKLDEEAIEKFRTSYAYDIEKVQKFVKEVEDSIAIINAVEIARDLTRPVIFKVVTDNSNQYEVSKIMDIYQGDVHIGRLIKKVSPGTFSKATYTFWKKIEPITINGIDFKWSPVAYCITDNTPFDIPMIAVIGKKEFKLKGNYAAIELPLANILVTNKLL